MDEIFEIFDLYIDTFKIIALLKVGLNKAP